MEVNIQRNSSELQVVVSQEEATGKSPRTHNGGIFPEKLWKTAWFKFYAYLTVIKKKKLEQKF